MADDATVITTRHVSPDGALTFVVKHEADDVTLGFEGTAWHTHGDVLASQYGLSWERAVARFVEELLQNRSVIAIATERGAVSDVWVVDGPLRPDPYKSEGEAITFRLWDGTPLDLGPRKVRLGR